MAKNVIFLVHGIGVHAEGWSQADGGPIETLSRTAEYYSGFSADEPLSGAVEFVEIRYDDIFDSIRTRWADLAESLNGNNNLPAATPQILNQLTGVIAQANGDSPLATHVLDVGLYTGFRLVQRLVQLRVASVMMNTIANHAQEPEGSRRYFVVAHSLGTTIAHDAIQRMATTGWLAEANKLSGLIKDSGFTFEDFQGAIDRFGKNPFSPGNFKFDAIFQLANTSRLLSQTVPAYKSSVCPMFSAGALKNAVRRFYNVDHVLDPIGKFQKHRAKEAWPIAASNLTAIDLFDINHIHDIDIHGFGHYLSHPEVHAHLLFSAAPTRFTLADFQIAMSRFAEGGDFQRFGGKFLDEDLRDNVESVLSTLSPNTLEKLPDSIESEVRGYLGGINVPGKVMEWLRAAVGLQNALDDLRVQIS